MSLTLSTTNHGNSSTATVSTTGTRRDPFDLLGLAVLNSGWYLIKGLATAIHWAVLFPPISVPIGFAITAGVVFGWPSGIALGVAFAAVIMLWRRRSPEMFERWITHRARTRFLTWWRYRRNWSRLMNACHLTVANQTRTVTPSFVGVAIGKGTDRVRLRMLEGQCPADYENRAETIAHAFKAEQCHATIVGPATVELRFRFGDALADTVLLPRVDHWTKPEGHTA
ncbi:hypothetical protein HGA13_12725 [Nocardia speluncae]|uniref:S-DNA-T family DNA segregation ATPase FtsK/SpoIIIE n=1 Tax=Nocardia speluncae TaxID=419477 RepID=A0A846XH55_9NOCA|nr:hypothetical protein [Nocardia speluncae]NKY33933.1 hypothetical protein [Nocardia speluncae]